MKKNNKGFSLVELIVVIAVMAVLVVVLAPAYLRYVDKAKLQKDISAVSEVVEAIKVSTAEEAVIADLNMDTNSYTTWTYVQIKGEEGATSSPITATKNLMQSASNLQTAVTEIVGSSITFSRKEVQSSNLVLLVGKDENYNTKVLLDVSDLSEYPEVQEEFIKAFECLDGASAANKLASIQAKINDFNKRYNEFMAAHSGDLDRADELEGLIDAKKNEINAGENYDEYTKNLSDARQALADAEAYLAQVEAAEQSLQARYDAETNWIKKAALGTELLAAKGVTAAAERVIPELEKAVDDAQAELDQNLANLDANKAELVELQAEYTQYEPIVKEHESLQQERTDLFMETVNLGGELGSDILGDIQGSLQG